ncbi:flagellar hook-associated protein 1 FlgK [Desulfurobacterium pacificum]|uniref:Flagellar hook-associated protein 1 n=1 Tax=Desulfurobacterium pacificum TaxID=240166 RepID=A0ABY1NXJ3_9BACT|nr:flagellar hook-associated protein FlgK [Desulfurobacterium pacificum]SMP18592.1 flagellar hook-associated protein 1 FlgK [Desulfurobacterium pacificum]
MALFAALSIASQALLANKTAINTTNRNMSNAYTDGYSREVPVFTDVPGGGTSIETIKRVFSKMYFTRYVSQNQNYNSLSSYQDILEQIESVFNDMQGSGFSNELNKFFDVMNDIALNPADLAPRAEFISTAQALVGRIRDSYSTLSEIKQTAVNKIRDEINALNDKLKALAEVNKNLKLYADSPDRLNQYLDKRDQLIKEISDTLDVKVQMNDNGTVNLFTAKGFALVLDDRANTIEFKTDENNNPQIYVSSTNITRDIENGTIGGTLKGINAINEAIDKLNTFTTTFANAINNQQEQGYDLYATPGSTTPNGEALFTTDNGSTTIDASNITLNFTDPKKIAAASSSDNLNADNENIKAMISLKDNTWADLNNMSFSEYYNTEIVSALGSELEYVKNRTENSKFLLDSIEDKMKELSSVNMDEELINLTKYQRAYEAAARVVTVTDELLQTVLGMVG